MEHSEEILITEGKSYYAQKTISSISNYKKCIDIFAQNFSDESSLKTETVLFLDTNILLRYYSISFIAREKLFEFIKKNQHRIILTNQVELEFLRNREDIIQRFFEQVTSKIPKDFSSDIVNKMKSFLDKHKVVLKDYSFVEPAIEKHKNELEELLKNLNQEVELKKKEHKDLIFKDKFLNLISNCTNYKSLISSELEIIKKHFDILAKGLSGDKIDSTLKKPNSAFPGLGDIKEKPDDPYGDYIIFHEIMKYMSNNKKDAIFLTFDNTKGDWMTKTKTSHLHYIQNIYNNTGNILYIIDAERALSDLLNVDINSLVKDKRNHSKTEISNDSLTNYAIRSEIFGNSELVAFSDNTIKELELNGYTTIDEVVRDLEKEKDGILKYIEDNPDISSTGILRLGLRIANPDCNIIVNHKTGEISKSLIGASKYINKYRTFDVDE